MNQTVDINRISLRSERSISDYLEMLVRRKWWFIPILLSGLILSLGLIFTLSPVYQSSATLFIEEQDIPDHIVQSTVNVYVEQRIEELKRRLMTRESLLGIIEKYNMYPELRDKLPIEAILGKMRRSIRIAMTRSDLLQGIQRRTNPNIGFDIIFQYPLDPEVTQQATNELVKLFLETNEKERREASEGTYNFLAAEVERLEGEANQINLELTKFKKENMGMLPEQVEVNMKVSERIDRDLAEVNRQLFDIKRQNVMLQSDLSSINRYSAMPSLTNELGEKVMSSEGRLQVLKSTYITMLSKYSPEHPKMRKVNNEITNLGGDVNFFGKVDRVYEELATIERRAQELKEIRGYDDPEVVRLEQQAIRLKGRMESYTQSQDAGTPGFSKEINPAYSSATTQLKVNQIEIESLLRKKIDLEAKRQEVESTLVMSPLIEVNYNKLNRDYDAVLEKIASVRKKMNTAEMADKLEASQKNDRFTLVDPPQVPFAPVKPNKKQILMLGFLLSSGLGFLVVYILEMSDKSIYNNSVLEKITGEKSLSVIPFLSEEFEEDQIEKSVKQRKIYAAAAITGVIACLMIAYLTVFPKSDGSHEAMMAQDQD